MKTLRILTLTATILFLTASSSFATASNDVLMFEYQFSEPEISPAVDEDSQRIEINGCIQAGKPGFPVLPVKPVRLLIPQGFKVAAISIEQSPSCSITGILQVVHGQASVPLNTNNVIQRTDRNDRLYNSLIEYPARTYGDVQVQWMCGARILTMNVYPVQCNPGAGKYWYYRSITIEVSLEPAGDPSCECSVFRGSSLDRLRISDAVDNPAVLDTYLARYAETSREDYRYVIITGEDFMNETGPYSFQALRDARIAQGLTSKIISTEWIYANYPGLRPDGGTDNATRIRNFIQDAYTNWGTEYILLGGDADGGDLGQIIVPVRGMTAGIPEDVYDTCIPSDMYYACLDGSFDENANGLYGEIVDGLEGGDVDIFAEVIVGRAVVDSSEEMRNFVRKTLAYESSNGDYLNRMLLAGEYMGFHGVSNWGGNLKEETVFGSSAHGVITGGCMYHFQTLDRLYDRSDPNQDWPKQAILEKINSGVHFINHLGHANTNTLMKTKESNIASLSNDEYCLIYSQGCFAGAFDNMVFEEGFQDSDCVAEAFCNLKHGAFAVIANSRLGWGAAATSLTSSQILDRQFIDAVTGDLDSGAYSPKLNIGLAHQDAREDTYSHFPYDLYFRYSAYGINLLGDPIVQLKVAYQDQDGDSIPDKWEELFGLNPVDPGDANSDPDADGISNYMEFVMKTHPLLAPSEPAWVDGSNTGGPWLGTETAPMAKIQDAVDMLKFAAVDEIVVREGEYRENVALYYNNVKITSCNPTDENVVRNTIINGGGEDTVVSFWGGLDRRTEFSGFTIINGMCINGGGISCIDSYPVISLCDIHSNKSAIGGGLCANGASLNLPVLYQCRIHNNEAYTSGGGIGLVGGKARITGCEVYLNTASEGAGLFAQTSLNSPEIELRNCCFRNNSAHDKGGALSLSKGIYSISDCTIQENSAVHFGGGINLLWGSELIMSGCNITSNRAEWGGGIYVNHNDFFHYIGLEGEKQNIFENNKAYFGNDLCHLSYGDRCVILQNNRFQGSPKSPYYVAPQASFNFNGNTTVRTDFPVIQYVNPDGNDGNDGLTCTTAVKTIHEALTRFQPGPDNPVKIQLAPGTYSPSTTGERFPIPLIGHLTISGSDPVNTILDAEATAPVIIGFDTEDAYLNRVTIRGGNASTELSGVGQTIHRVDRGGGLMLLNTSAHVTDCIITENQSDDKGGGVFIRHCNWNDQKSFQTETSLINCLIANNYSEKNAGGVSVYYSEDNGHVTMQHCTITSNETGFVTAGMEVKKSRLTMENSIIWGNQETGYDDYVSVFCTPQLTFSDIRSDVVSGSDLIDLDPLFVQGLFGDYYLSQPVAGDTAKSPCVDAGSMAAAECVYDVPQGEADFSRGATRKDMVTDSGIVDMGFHYPEPALEQLGVTLNLSKEVFHPGDRFKLTATVSNNGVFDLGNKAVCIVLCAYGQYFWFPDWKTGFGYLVNDIEQGQQTLDIFDFLWPDISGSADGILLAGSLLDPDSVTLIGGIFWIEFGWSRN